MSGLTLAYSLRAINAISRGIANCMKSIACRLVADETPALAAAFTGWQDCLHGHPQAVGLVAAVAVMILTMTYGKTRDDCEPALPLVPISMERKCCSHITTW